MRQSASNGEAVAEIAGARDNDEFKRVADYGFVSGKSVHADRIATIRDVQARHGLTIDTHTADGVKVAREHLSPGVPMVVLETALPAKFGDTIREALDREPERPAGYADIESLPQRFETVPNDFLEAARIDGLNEFAIFWRIALPLVTPALSALAIFTFLSNWTAFIWPLIVTTSKELYTLPVGLTSFAVESQVQWELIMTGAALATLPTLTVFLLLQRYIVRGVVLAGLKG